MERTTTQIAAREAIDTGLLADIIHVFASWEYNWKSSDFKEAFRESPVGWEWLWEKFEASDKQPYSFYLVLDHQHQCMLVKYLYEVKYAGEIDSYKMTRELFKKLTEGGE